jgi:hypothetical protein
MLCYAACLTEKTLFYSVLFLLLIAIAFFLAMNHPQIDTAPVKSGLSDSMKERLIREASTGLDSEKPQTNVILYIGIVVAILVALAGGGILF